MKTITNSLFRLVVGGVFTYCLTSFTQQAFAIEGLKITVPSANAVLSWPSTNTETYIVQYRNTLSATDSWVTLADYFPASSTNITYFVDSSNVVQFSSLVTGGGGSGGGIVLPSDTSSLMSSESSLITSDVATDDTSDDMPPLPWDIFPMLSGDGSLSASSSMSMSQLDSGGGIIMSPDGLTGSNGSSGTGFYRVVRDGAHVYGLTNNSTLSGEVQMPIEIAVGSTDTIQSVTFYNVADDSPVIGVTAYTNSGGGWTFDWNTVKVQNGNYNIYAEVDFTTDDPVSSAAIPVSINVNNVISFPNYFTCIYGSQMWVYAQTIANVPYTLDMYDDGTNYLGTFSGNADSGGTISFLWDLTDGNGYTFTSTNFFGAFTVTPSLSMQSSSLANNSASTSSPAFQRLEQKPMFQPNGAQPNGNQPTDYAIQTWALEPNTWWSRGNKFVIAYAPLKDPVADPVTVLHEQLMMLGGWDGNDGGVIGSLGGNDFSGQLSPGNVPQTSAFQMNDGPSKTNLLSYLGDYSYRNFYFFGHGNPSVIAGVNSASAINKDTIARTLGNFLTAKRPSNFHPYRFVFIDGCDCGKGNFCEAFGIPAQTVNNQFFANAAVVSRAFIGFKKTINFDSAQWDYRSMMLGQFFTSLQINTPVSICVYNAKQATFQPMDASVVIYGATDLQINSY